MIKADELFKKNIKEILENGVADENVRPRYKDGTPAYTKFITQVFETYDISKGEFPLTNLRPIAIRNGIKEIFWIYQDADNTLELLEKKYGITWWKDWDIGDNTIGQRYGATVKKYDLTRNLIKGLKEDPYSRRHIMSLYQYEDFKETKGLHPCAFETQFSVRGKYLDMTLIQR